MKIVNTRRVSVGRVRAIFVLSIMVLAMIVTPFDRALAGAEVNYDLTQHTSGGSRNWISMDTSADGTFIIGAEQPGYIYTSSDSGNTWTEHTDIGSRDWVSVASSADGQRLIAAAQLGALYTSDNGGATWTQHGDELSSNAWYTVASSPDGMKMFAGEFMDGTPLYVSTDGGTTWTQRTDVGVGQWISIAVADNGEKVIAAEYNALHLSNDGGATWTDLNAPVRNWCSVAISADGMKIAATEWDGFMYLSSDGGNTWEGLTSPGLNNTTYFVSMSADGTKLAATEWEGLLYTSSDGGLTWEGHAETGPLNWYSVSSSTDGKNIVASVYGGYIYTLSQTQVINPPEVPDAPVPVTPPEPPSVPAPATQPTAPVAEAMQPRKVSPVVALAETQRNDAAPLSGESSSEKKIWIDMKMAPNFMSGRGEMVQLRTQDGISFMAAHEPHTVTIDDIKGDLVTFTLRSIPQVHSLRVGETGRYDVNNDGVSDISVVIKGISNNVADISFAAITPPRESLASRTQNVNSTKGSAPVLLMFIVGLVVLGGVVLTLVLKMRHRTSGR